MSKNPSGPRIPMKTWSGKSTFEYEGTVKDGITLHYGKGHKNLLEIRGTDLVRAMAVFKGKEVSIGTHHSKPPAGSFGHWFQGNVTKTSVASYLGPIFIAEGYAKRGSQPDLIQFL